MQLKRTQNPINRQGRNELNENWETLERTYKKVVDDSSEALSTANQANGKSDNAVNTANNAEHVAEIVQEQFNQVVAEAGSNNPEVVAGRTDTETGETFVTIGERLDLQHKEVSEKLIEREKGEVKGLEYAKYKIVAGAIRNSGSGWGFIDDTGHRPTNGVNLTVDSQNRLKLDFGFRASKVTSLTVTPDETLAKMGVASGASVGLSEALIEFSMPFSAITTGKTTVSTHAFFTPSTTIEELTDGSGYKITHNTSLLIDQVTASPVIEASGRASVEVRATYNENSITVSAYEDLNGYILYDGTDWIIYTDAITKPTMAFNSSDGQLTVTHEATNAPYGLSVDGRMGIHPQIYSTSATTFIVQFYDMQGNLITTPSTSMRFYFSRPSKVKRTMPTNTRVMVRRGNIKINPNDLVSAGGNFWINGLMEI